MPNLSWEQKMIYSFCRFFLLFLSGDVNKTNSHRSNLAIPILSVFFESKSVLHYHLFVTIRMEHKQLCLIWKRELDERNLCFIVCLICKRIENEFKAQQSIKTFLDVLKVKTNSMINIKIMLASLDNCQTDHLGTCRNRMIKCVRKDDFEKNIYGVPCVLTTGLSGLWRKKT